MGRVKGKRLPLSPGRAIVAELLHHAKKVPTLPLARDTRIDGLVGLRRATGVSWTSIFVKAYATLAMDLPELRRAYMPYPWPSLYEHPESIAAVLVERQVADETAVLAARVRAPESSPLEQVDRTIRNLQTMPVNECGCFRQLVRLGKLPSLARRFVFWHSLYLSGFWRCKRFGTFMVSSLGNLGVEQIHPLTVLTTYLTFGAIRDEREVNVKVIYDHRVMDGRTVARGLKALEDVLNGPIRTELATLAEAATPKPAGVLEDQYRMWASSEPVYAKEP